MADVVDANLHFKSLFGLGERAGHDAGVAEEDVETRELSVQSGTKSFN